MTHEQLTRYIATEAILIKKYATPEELASIKFRINKKAGYANLYAEMAGNPNNQRAKELLSLCATATIKHSTGASSELKDGQSFKRGRLGYNQNVSALEWYLLQTHFKKSARRPLINFFLNNAQTIVGLENIQI